MKNLCRILPNLQFSPLNNQWYVCLPMLAPIPAAMVLKNSYIPIMQSYIESPEEHMALSREMSLVGGPFVNYPTNRSREVADLLKKICLEQKNILDLSDAIKNFSNFLNKKATGYSLEPEYQEIPELLKGYVELVYDLSHRPNLRFIEQLLYKSPYFCRKSQSVACSLIQEDRRPFVLSTPRLMDEHHIQIDLPFDSPLYDDLFKTREYPEDFELLIEKFGISREKIPLLKSFVEFSKEPQVREDYRGEAIRIRYFGHACLLIECNGISILIDPFISYAYDTKEPRFTFADLPPTIDYVLITHGHLDHMVLETLLQIRYKVKCFVVPRNGAAIYADPSLKLLLLNLGFTSIIEVDSFDEIPISQNMTLTAMPFLGEHHDLNIMAKTAFLLNIQDKKIYIAADSSNIAPALYDHIFKFYGKIDALFIGMECDGAPLSWFYGPLLPNSIERDKDYSRQGSGSDCQKALALVNSLRPESVYVYAMGMEPWFSYILGLNYTKNSKQLIESDKFIETVHTQNIKAERLYAKKEFIL